jgi:hypothetical protein
MDNYEAPEVEINLDTNYGVKLGFCVSSIICSLVGLFLSFVPDIIDAISEHKAKKASK